MHLLDDMLLIVSTAYLSGTLLEHTVPDQIQSMRRDGRVPSKVLEGFNTNWDRGIHGYAICDSSDILYSYTERK